VKKLVVEAFEGLWTHCVLAAQSYSSKSGRSLCRPNFSG